MNRIAIVCHECKEYLTIAVLRPQFGWQVQLGMRPDMDQHTEVDRFMRVHQGHELEARLS